MQTKYWPAGLPRETLKFDESSPARWWLAQPSETPHSCKRSGPIWFSRCTLLLRHLTLMNEHQSEMAFLRTILVYDNTEERHNLEEQIAQFQRDERSLLSALWLMALLTALSATGFAYGVIVDENFPDSYIVQVAFNLGLASLICFVTYASILTVHRKKLTRVRKECQRLISRLLESHVGKPQLSTLRGSRPGSDEGEVAPCATQVHGSSGGLDSLRALVSDGQNSIPQQSHSTL